MKKIVSLGIMLAIVMCILPIMSKNAKAGQNDYTLTFNANGGHIGSANGPGTKTVTLPPSSYAAGLECSEAKNTAYRTGYTFLGWFDANGKQYKSGVTGSPAVVYAHWQKSSSSTTTNTPNNYAVRNDAPNPNAAMGPTKNGPSTIEIPNHFVKGNTTNFNVSGWALHDRGINSYWYTIKNKSTGAPISGKQNIAISALDRNDLGPTAKSLKISTGNYITHTWYNGNVSISGLGAGTYIACIYGKTNDGQTFAVAEITFSIKNGSITAKEGTTTVTQIKAPNAGITKTLIIQANGDGGNWQASVNQTWVTLTPDKKNNKLKVQVKASSSSNRTATITLTCGGATQKITVTQGPCVNGHDWTGWVDTEVATCTLEGIKTRVCKRANCDACEKVPVARIPHQYVDGGECYIQNSDGTYDATYHLTTKCAMCGKAAKEKHNFVETVIPGKKDLIYRCDCGLRLPKVNYSDHIHEIDRDNNHVLNVYEVKRVYNKNDNDYDLIYIVTRPCKHAGCNKSYSEIWMTGGVIITTKGTAAFSKLYSYGLNKAYGKFIALAKNLIPVVGDVISTLQLATKVFDCFTNNGDPYVDLAPRQLTGSEKTLVLSQQGTRSTEYFTAANFAWFADLEGGYSYVPILMNK